MGIALTHLIPFSELAPGQAGKIRNDIIQRMVSMAVQGTKKPEELLVVRDIRAKDDLDYSNEDWWEKTGSSTIYETMTTGTMGDERYVGIYGVKLDPELPLSCTALKFNIGGGDKAIWQLQDLREQDDMVGFCPSGIIIPQNVIYTISRLVLYTLSPFHCVLKGVVVEPRGKVISP